MDDLKQLNNELGLALKNGTFVSFFEKNELTISQLEKTRLSDDKYNRLVAEVFLFAVFGGEDFYKINDFNSILESFKRPLEGLFKLTRDARYTFLFNLDDDHFNGFMDRLAVENMDKNFFIRQSIDDAYDSDLILSSRVFCKFLYGKDFIPKEKNFDESNKSFLTELNRLWFYADSRANNSSLMDCFDRFLSLINKTEVYNKELFNVPSATPTIILEMDNKFGILSEELHSLFEIKRLEGKMGEKVKDTKSFKI